jgi:hypothetical protein
VNELFSKLKSAEVDRGMTAKIECSTDANPSTRIFSLSSLMSMPDEEFDMLGEDELALLTRRFERLHEDMLPVRQAGILHRRLPEEGREQGWLQVQVKNGWQVPVKVRPQ